MLAHLQAAVSDMKNTNEMVTDGKFNTPTYLAKKHVNLNQEPSLIISYHNLSICNGSMSIFKLVYSIQVKTNYRPPMVSFW